MLNTKMSICVKNTVNFFVCLCFCFGLIKFLPFFAEFQRIERHSNQVDALIVLGGGNGNRIRHAYDLYLQGVSDTFVLTGNATPYFLTDDISLMSEYLLFLDENISHVYIEGQSQSTLDHAIFLEPYVKKFQWKKVMIITSAFHSRRAYFVFKKRWSNLGVDVFVSGAEDHVEVKSWWKHYEMTETVLSEWFRFFLYLWIV